MKRIQQLFALLIMVSLLGLAACAGSESSRSTGAYVDDKAISTKVKAKLASDSMTEAMKVEVETYKGVVQLSGFVDNKETVRRAGEIARSVEGVKEVKNNLLVR
jgi:hyperosmotically inducible protein